MDEISQQQTRLQWLSQGQTSNCNRCSATGTANQEFRRWLYSGNRDPVANLSPRKTADQCQSTGYQQPTAALFVQVCVKQAWSAEEK
jgi:hypothetical protein